MKKGFTLFVVVLGLAVTGFAHSADSDFIAKVDQILSKAPENDYYHVTSFQVNDWLKADKNDFIVVDVRTPPEDGKWGMPQYGRIPGSIHIPNTEFFHQENLKKLPKDKKIILVGHMGIQENYLVIPLRIIGYDAYFMLMGMSGWQKDYPATGHVNGLINAAREREYPLEKEHEGISHQNKRHGHSRQH